MIAPAPCRAPLAFAMLVAGLLSACSFSADLDTGYIAPCSSDADCAVGQICSDSGYCYAGERDAVLDVAPDTVDDLDVSPPDSTSDSDTASPDTSDTAQPDGSDQDQQDQVDVLDMVDGSDMVDMPDVDTTCGGLICSASQTCCTLDDGSKTCVDLTVDTAHCGACGSACGELEQCTQGMCACPLSDTGTLEICDSGAGEVCCDKGCSNILASASNCGACGNACNPGEVCVDGGCVCGDTGAACAAGTLCCNGACCGDSELCCEEVCKPASDPTCECGTEGICAADQVCCRTGVEPTCSGLQADPQHCGACGNTCAAGEACLEGACVCSDGFTDCDGDPANGCEVETASDDANCGACGSACAAGLTCSSGVCVCGNGEPLDTVNNCGFCSNACLTGQTCCGGSCVSLSNDENHCSACGTSCAAGEQCCSGSCLDPSGDENNCGFCGNACSAGQQCCGGICQDLINDDNNCGACGNVCGAGQTCCNGGCVDTTSSASNCGFCGNACPAGRTCCGGACRALLSDINNCGGCGIDCTPPANATALCDSGACDYRCLTGFADCDGLASNGCEVDLATSATHCGGCGNTCSSFHGTASCTSGTCEIACDAGWANCDGSAMNGCEIQTSSDVANCGTCSNLCSSDGGTASCSSGMCAIACSPGFADCNGSVIDGCEVDLSSNSSHCTTCNNACPGGQVCVSGVCTSSNCANAGEIECSGVCYDLDTSATHCGSCTNDCTSHVNVSSATCSGGSCSYICLAGFADCTSSAGCETSTDSNPSHCGACGNACASINGTATCSGGACGIVCNAGFGDCNGSAADGCEKSLNTDVNNCGGCNVVCSSTNGTPSCNLGTCETACNAGYADCDGNAANGCEVNLNTSTSNCGTCGNICSSNNGSPGCSSGACTIACHSGWGNCNGNISDGCETSLTTSSNCTACGLSCSNVQTCCPSGCARLDRDADNCGTCGTVCASINGSASCSGGACSITCNSGWRNCDGDFSNGCEYQGSSCPEVCGDGIDNDSDGATDCNDIDCRDHTSCTPPCPEFSLGSATGTAVASGTTTLKQNNFSPTCGGSSGRDVSYSWTAPSGACWQLDTDGSGIDTVLAMYSSCGGSQTFCNNDDATLGTRSRIQAQLAASSAHLIVVDSNTSTTGSYQLNVSALGASCAGEIDCADGVDNDSNGQIDCADTNCAVATVCVSDCSDGDLASATGSPVSSGTTSGMGNDHTATCAGTASSPDLAFWWTAPTSATYVIDTIGSSYDTALHMWTGCGGTQLACDDDSGGSLKSLIAYSFTAGQRVLIVVDGYSSSSSGSYVLNINLQ